MNTPELTSYEERIFKELKQEWRKLGFRIYTDYRKTFYRIKLYRATKYYANKAKKIAKKFGVESKVEPTYHSFYNSKKYNGVIRHPYFNMEN